MLAVASEDVVTIFKVAYGGEQGKGGAGGLKITVSAVLKDFNGEVCTRN